MKSTRADRQDKISQKQTLKDKEEGTSETEGEGSSGCYYLLLYFCLLFALCLMRFIPLGLQSIELNNSPATVFAMVTKEYSFVESSASVS